jgi:hypothetical protein
LAAKGLVLVALLAAEVGRTMAAWQFDFRLLPRMGVTRVHGAVPISIGRGIDDFSTYWAETVISSRLRDQISKVVPCLESWSSRVERWGSEDGDRIDLVFVEGKIVDFFVRADTRNLSFKFLKGVLNIARHHDWLVVTSDRRVTTPELARLLAAIQTSNAFQFVIDPAKFFALLKAEQAEPKNKTS